MSHRIKWLLVVGHWIGLCFHNNYTRQTSPERGKTTMRDLQQRIKKRRLAVLISLIGVLAFASLALSNGPPSYLGYEGSASFVRSLVPRRLAYDMSTTTLPSYTDNHADVWFTLQPTDTPFFWYIPRSGGATLQKIAAQCLNLVSASPRGIQNPHVSTGRMWYDHT